MMNLGLNLDANASAEPEPEVVEEPGRQRNEESSKDEL